MVKIMKGHKGGKEKYIEEVIKRCKVCQKGQMSKERPKVSLVKPKGWKDV